MRVTVTGATGLVGSRLIAELKARGDDVTLLSRNPERARESVGAGWEVVRWDPDEGPAPREALDGRDGVVHLAGEPIAQRWNAKVKERIRSSREIGTRNLVAGLRNADPKPAVLVSSSAVGFYGFHGDEELTEETPPGDDFLAEICQVWEREAEAASDFGIRVVRVRTGVVLDADGGALKTMLPPFKLGVGGPVAGGSQYLPWVHLDDVVGIMVSALNHGTWHGAVNATAPTPVTNKTFSKALGRALKRPAISPVPAAAVNLLYGEMAEMVTKGQRAVPKHALALGYEFRHPDLDEALRHALDK
jgi:uncharacterized protein (TIGR01777 family)